MVACRPVENGTGDNNKECPLACVKGDCVSNPQGGYKCNCHPLYEGKLCDKYRCSQYCKNKGFCVVDTLAQPGPRGEYAIMVSFYYFKAFFW
jgi:hypothetical protein